MKPLKTTKKKAKFAPSKLIAYQFAPIVHFPSGQKFDEVLYHVFFERAFSIFNEKGVDSVIEAIWLKTLQVVQEVGEPVGEYGETVMTLFEGHEAVERFLISVLGIPPSKNQLSDCYDFSTCDPTCPERSFHKLKPIERQIVEHIAVDFGARINYSVHFKPEVGSQVAESIRSLREAFILPVERPVLS